MTYEPDLRAPYVIPCGSHDGGDAEPRYLHPHLRDKNKIDGFLQGQFESSPSSRVAFHWPVGKTDANSSGDICGSAQWWSAPVWRRDAYIRHCKEWKANNPENTVEIYMDCTQYDPHLAVPSDLCYELDTRNALSIQWFMETVTPWMNEIGIHRVWLDNSSNPSKIWGAYRTAYRLDLPFPLGMEAVPLGWRLKVKTWFWRTMPYMCTDRFALTRDNFPARTQVPEGCEGVIWLTGHEPDATPVVIERWRNKGWVVGSLARQHDHLVWGP
jgi:hypothetical protein